MLSQSLKDNKYKESKQSNAFYLLESFNPNISHHLFVPQNKLCGFTRCKQKLKMLFSTKKELRILLYKNIDKQ